MKGGHGQISYMTLLWVHLTIHLVHPINSQLCRITGQLSLIIINNNIIMKVLIVRAELRRVIQQSSMVYNVHVGLE